VNQSSLAVIDLLRAFFGDAIRTPRWPKPLHLLQGTLLILAGNDVASAAHAVGTTPGRLEEVATDPEPVEAVLRLRDADLTADALGKQRRKVGDLVLGRAAEIAFQDICRENIDPREYSLTDVREGRTNTDFRLLNGGRRPLYRFNVKFIGAVFRRGAEMVKIDPTDCFPLATYKILAALQEQEKEHLPYVFAIVSVPGLVAATVAEIIPEAEVRPVALLSQSDVVTRSRDYEDWLVDRIVAAREPAFATAYDRIRAAQWYVLSARRADNLMHAMLFDRVYALAIPGFTRKFGGAEVDMHFSLSKDLMSLPELLAVLRQDGQGRVTTMLERGTV
jgi:hypothetical protein